ncbi:MAG: hypothetical protein IKE94_06370 [Aeriscardovia sp.]|nr:hypothetical protein [Aeriscardovia sp.]
MNNAKLVVSVIIICIVSPILVGYVWPVGTDSETGYEVGDPVNITSDSINSKLPIYVPYNDPQANNQNVFNGTFFNNFAETVTGSAGPVWSALNPVLQRENVYVTEFGIYTINDVKVWQDWTGVRAVVFSEFDWLGLQVGDYPTDLVVYYPASDKLFYKPYGADELVNTDIRTLYFTNAASYETVELDYIVYLSEDYYAELSYGMIVPRDTSTWFNGYVNKGANIIFGTTNNNQIVNLVLIDPYGSHNTTIQIRVDSGVISLKVTNSNMTYQEDLGSNAIYDKVLLTIDYDSETIALSGLRGLDSYIGDYNNAIRQTIQTRWHLPIMFYSFTIDRNNSAQTTDWYVADTLSAVAETDGSWNYHMNLRDYNATGSCQLNIKNVQLHGDYISFRINNNYIYGYIENGKMTFTDLQGNDFDVSVNNILVGIIDNSFYINGHEMKSYSSITSAEITFSEGWIMSLYYYPVEQVTVESYSWLPGGFGLDVNGFCMVGLITSALSGMAASLYGRRSGAKMVFVTFTSGIIAAVYLIILMGGL